MSEVPIVPAPVRAEQRPGEPFAVRPGMRVVAGPQPVAVSTAILTAGRIGDLVGFPVVVVQDDDGGPGALVLQVVDSAAELDLPADLDPALAREAYRLEVAADRMTVTALDGAGLMRGMSSLQQLSRPGGADDPLWFPPCLVVDHPRFPWRGLSIDLARHFFGVDDVKTVIDTMRRLKLNVLHLHLTDDQGWRLALPSRPALAERSGGTAVGGDPGGFLTVEDYAELLTYAASRHITVVPELDVPGHTNAALHAYGELTPSGEPEPEYTGIEVGFSRLHLGLPATEPFLRDVFGDVAAMTPGTHLHIGGDEVLTMAADEYAGLVAQAADAVRAAGKVVVGWQEIASVLTAETAPGTVVQYWDEREGAEAVTAAAALGAQVLLSPASKVYLDMRYDASTPVGLDWAGHIELRDSYDWEPLDVLPGVPAEQVIGVEAAIWTETVRTADDLFLLLLPRLAAVAEVAWSQPDRRDWDGFAARVAQQTHRWDQAGLAWYRSPQVEWLRRS